MLTRLRLRRGVTPLFALFVAYGLGDIVNDGFEEQIVERGGTLGLSELLHPAANWGWAAVRSRGRDRAVWLRRTPDRKPEPRRSPRFRTDDHARTPR